VDKLTNLASNLPHFTYILACRASSAYVDNLSKPVKVVDRMWIRAHDVGIRM
jgi:hypothetical protein